MRLAIAAAIVLWTACHASAATVSVDPTSGRDEAGCGQTVPCQTYTYATTGRRIDPGDTISLAPGTYRERIVLRATGTLERPVSLVCSGQPGSCVVSGQGQPVVPWDALVIVRGAFVAVSRLSVEQVPAGMYGIALVDSHHVELRGLRLDGRGASNNLIVTSGRNDWVTLARSSLTNCPAGSTGCTYWRNVSHLAVVGNDFGPVAGGGNFDCNTVIGTTVGLIDGNTCRDTVDGFDEGMDSMGVKLDRVVVRYNRVTGKVTGRAFPISGQYDDTTTLTTGSNAVYKNLAQIESGSCFQAYGGAQDLLLAHNTCVTTGGYGSGVWLETEWDRWVQRVAVTFNLFDSPTAVWTPPIVLGSSKSTVRACPADAPCPIVGNVIDIRERGSDWPAVSWAPSAGGLGASETYSMADWSTRWNTVSGNSGNLRTDAKVALRSGWQFGPPNLAPVAGSPLVDAAEPFCRATSAGSGTTVPVTCSTDPRVVFPVSADYYRVAQNDCFYGTRPFEPSGAGCFDVQVEGCGRRRATVVSGSSVSLAGSPCSWKSGAIVHVPYESAKPDVGALEVRL